ncbi:MAG: HAD hydrolase-like protein [Candidatus Paceibacterota bacterium]|jgi:hypothetical protein
MKKSNLFFDLDDTILNTKPVVIEFINKKYNVNITESDYRYNDNFPEVIKKYDPKFKMSFEDFYIDYGKNFIASIDSNKNIQLISGAKVVIPFLYEKYNLFIVTAREKSGMNVINYLLKKYLSKNYFKQIHCVWRRAGDTFVAESKKDFILSIHGKKVAFIDDSVKEVQKMSDFLPTFLFDQKDENKIDGIKTLKNWSEIAEMFL